MLIQIPEGTVILKEGEANMDMYKIVSGHVEVYAGYGTESETILGIMSKGSYFGELGLLTQKPAIYTIVAFSDLLLNRITMEEIDDYIANNHHDIFAIMKNMADTMYNLKFNIDLLLNDAANADATESLKGLKQLNALMAKQMTRYNVNGMSVARNAFHHRA